MKNYSIAVNIFLLLSVVSACRKETDTVSPHIQLTSPAENSSYEVFDTIHVAADLSDNNQLSHITLQLVSENQMPAMPLKKTSLSGKEKSYTSHYPLSDPTIQSGFYYLKIVLSDAVNETRSFTKVYISETETSANGIFIISTPSSYSVQVNYLDSSLNPSLFLSLNCDYTASCLSSEFQYLNILGSFQCGLNSYRISDNALQWQEPSLGSSPYFVNLTFYNEISYVCYQTGNIKGFDKNGSLVFSAVSPANYRPVNSFWHNSILFVEEGETGGNGKQISKYFSTGSYAESIPVGISIVRFTAKDNDNLLLFGNAGGQGKIYVYEITNDNLWIPYVLSAGSFIYDALQIDPNTYLVAMADGIYKYTYLPSNFIQQKSFPGITRMKYDEINNRVLVAAGNLLLVYNYSNWVQLNSYTHNNNIREFQLHFNK